MPQVLSPDDRHLLEQLVDHLFAVLRRDGPLQYYRVQPGETTLHRWLQREAAGAGPR
jgi:hypothetical protein